MVDNKDKACQGAGDGFHGGTTPILSQERARSTGTGLWGSFLVGRFGSFYVLVVE